MRALRVTRRTLLSSAWRPARSFSSSALRFADTDKKMFCFQCEQTKEGTGCTTIGVCGKTPEVAKLQDLLIHTTKAISMYATRARAAGIKDEKLDSWLPAAIFSTLTNVNFDEKRFTQEFLVEANKYLDLAKGMYKTALTKTSAMPPLEKEFAEFKLAPTNNQSALNAQAEEIGILARKKKYGDDFVGLQELVTYGLKGALAYAHHAAVLGKESDEIYDFMHQTLDFLTKKNVSIDQLLGAALAVGEANYKIMEKLDFAATTKYGHPEPTKVRVTPVKGKCIAVSGHDLRDLELVLKQTEGKGINVYTHGELLPAHGYPGLKKYKHLVGNYGGAWQLQQLEFSMFPGAVLMTTNCIIQPRKIYNKRIFTRDVVGWPGVSHLKSDDLTPLINAALSEEGFQQDDAPKYAMTGFAHNAVLSVADKIVHAIKAGQINHIYLIGGCDGAEPGRDYFKKVALATPKDSLILTLACGKYRFNKLEFGELAGFPRLLDVGQCNDAYSAIQIAAGLAKAFNTDVNGLPLSFVVSWFEQKAVAVLLTLLYLGVKNIYLGPALPAFATKNMLNILVDKFKLHPIGDSEKDMKAMNASK